MGGRGRERERGVGGGGGGKQAKFSLGKQISEASGPIGEQIF